VLVREDLAMAYIRNIILKPIFLSLTLFFACSSSQAVHLDWSGQFWFDNHWLNNYQLNRSKPGYDADPDYYNTGGPYVPGAGEKNVIWFSAFMKLKPKVVVNDSIILKSEWHVGSPIYGFMGRDFPNSGGEQYNFTGSQKNGAAITAARFWANLITDFGTIEIGRAPIHWGLGAIWNSGDNLYDRYQSSGDMVRLVAKFGSITVSPAIVKVSMGNSVAGALDTSSATTSFPSVVNPKEGNDDVTDYQIAAKYENTEEDFDFGMMWDRRVGNKAQSGLLLSPTGSGSKKLNFNLFDFYVKKKLSRFTLGLEIPFYTGVVGGIDGSANDFKYSSLAVIVEASYTSDQWDIALKGGRVPGQPVTNASGQNVTTIDTGTKYRAIYLHKNYGLGLIMFKYNLYGLGANNPDTQSASSLRSPYDNPIVNANYVSLSPTFKLDKWAFHATFLGAWAMESVPNEAGKVFYNHHRRTFHTVATNSGSQSSFMGWEMDYGVAFKWDDNFVADWEVGLFFPGKYYNFANRSWPNHELGSTNFMFASQIRAGITF